MEMFEDFVERNLAANINLKKKTAKSKATTTI